MKKIFSALILLTLLLAACSTRASSVETNVLPLLVEAEVAALDATTSNGIERQAVITETKNTVSVRATANDGFSPATAGLIIFPNGGLETGRDGHARLDLLPDGTIVRVGPNSSFTIFELDKVDGQPKTTIELVFGKIYILLKGGSLSVKTSTGVASVRGSVLSVEFDPATKRVKAACLEGHCALADEQGNEVEMTQNETSYMDVGKPPIHLDQIDRSEIQNWLDEVPEMSDFFEELPKPEDYFEPDSSGNDNNGNGGENQNDNNNGNGGGNRNDNNNGNNDGNNDDNNNGNNDDNNNGNNDGNNDGNNNGNDNNDHRNGNKNGMTHLILMEMNFLPIKTDLCSDSILQSTQSLHKRLSPVHSL